MRKSRILVLGIPVLLICLQTALAQHNFKPPAGYVPDERTAVAVAEAILIPIYGADNIRTERPFRATLRGKIWVVEGTLPTGMVGGVALVEISKEDGRVLRVIHGK